VGNAKEPSAEVPTSEGMNADESLEKHLARDVLRRISILQSNKAIAKDRIEVALVEHREGNAVNSCGSGQHIIVRKRITIGHIVAIMSCQLDSIRRIRTFRTLIYSS
jgi:hypothetical protein